MRVRFRKRACPKIRIQEARQRIAVTAILNSSEFLTAIGAFLPNDLEATLQFRRYANRIEDAFAAHRPDVVEAILTDLDVRSLTDQSLVGIPRATCRARQVLRSWNSVYAQCRAELILRGRDPIRLFVGMKEHYDEHAQDSPN